MLHVPHCWNQVRTTDTDTVTLAVMVAQTLSHMDELWIACVTGKKRLLHTCLSWSQKARAPRFP